MCSNLALNERPGTTESSSPVTPKQSLTYPSPKVSYKTTAGRERAVWEKGSHKGGS